MFPKSRPRRAGDLDYEYLTRDSEELSDIRGYLYRKRKQGWNLYWIEGRSMHFRRRRSELGGGLAA